MFYDSGKLGFVDNAARKVGILRRFSFKKVDFRKKKFAKFIREVAWLREGASDAATLENFCIVRNYIVSLGKLLPARSSLFFCYMVL